ncbi:MAG TPA: thioredoxin domain-containing protein [Puia sp.]|nr:thioredoxin domain-containing protein [Puia sp.]
MNRLAAETSPYLLQHSHNPVDWYPWGEEALQRARAEDKPILVSIGYAACHWCHVMERESFEDDETARFMNDHFVNIKIDREERPDLDHIYMDAVQAITGSGGWPLNVFLTPDAKPFYGGTYFPPRAMANRPSWKDVLAGISRSFRERKEEIIQQAESLTSHIATAGSFGIGASTAGTAATTAGTVASTPDTFFNPDTLRQVRDQLMATADRTDGGFGHAPKFPQTFSIRWLLHYHHFTKNQAALDQACLSLDKMIRGGIYDHLGGGLARYSTDNEWLAPHFEKMLYDNALLVIALSDAYRLTPKDEYKKAIEGVMEFIDRELSNGEGGFYAALDADSEGIEGKYYVWDQDEIESVLKEDAALFCLYYGVTPQGNWEAKNILTRPGAANRPAIETVEWTPEQLRRLDKSRLRLLAHRSGRIRPALDDKILLGWNALMNIACSRAYAALGNEEYRDRAIQNHQFCRSHFNGPGGIYHYFHSYKAGQAKYPAFLDDYSYLIASLIDLQEVTGDPAYLLEAKTILEFVCENFTEGNTDFFFFTHQEQPDLIVRKKEVYDGATPSGNSMMAFNLLYLSVIFDRPEWGDRARRMAAALHRPVTGYPGSFGIWATLYMAVTYTIPEVVITGKRPENARKEFLKQFIPYRVFQSASEENTQFPLLLDKSAEDVPRIFLCKNYACQLPVNEVTTLVRLLENVQKFQ